MNVALRVVGFAYLTISIHGAAVAAPPAAVEPPVVELQLSENQVVFEVGGQPVATYVFRDKVITRPYFAHVKAPGGIQVTRNHPPIAGKDRDDHAELHPGIWLAFGDLSGHDYWRNKAPVIHKRFLKPPKGGRGRGTFTQLKHYLKSSGDIVCREEFQLTLRVLEEGYLLEWDCLFSSDQDFYFGDQEEMGLGIRLTTPVSGLKDGRLLNAEGQVGEKGVWGNATKWCDYSGPVDGKHVGMTILCHPQNVRPSWMHARDYGFVAANLFGRNAMRKGKPSRIQVKRGEHFRLKYGVLLHARPQGQAPNIEAVYTRYARR